MACLFLRGRVSELVKPPSFTGFFSQIRYKCDQTYPPALPAGARHRARAGKPTTLLTHCTSRRIACPALTDMRGHADPARARSTMLVLRELCRARRRRGLVAVAPWPGHRGLLNTGSGGGWGRKGRPTWLRPFVRSPVCKHACMHTERKRVGVVQVHDGGCT
jgi:hypothetical protein